MVAIPQSLFLQLLLLWWPPPLPFLWHFHLRSFPAKARHGLLYHTAEAPPAVAPPRRYRLAGWRRRPLPSPRRSLLTRVRQAWAGQAPPCTSACRRSTSRGRRSHPAPEAPPASCRRLGPGTGRTDTSEPSHHGTLQFHHPLTPAIVHSAMQQKTFEISRENDEGGAH